MVKIFIRKVVKIPSYIFSSLAAKLKCIGLCLSPCSDYKLCFICGGTVMLHARFMNITVMLRLNFAPMLYQFYATDIAFFYSSVLEGTNSMSHFLLLSHI